MQINVVNLKKHFGSTHAVNDVNFTFGVGQIIGFVGPNGAGKTTTMRIMATLDDATGGDVFLDGVSVTEDPETARRLIGYVPDNEPAPRDMTVHDYLDFFARAYELPNPRRDTVVHGVEDFTNLLGIRDKQMNSLSKGMKQRVSLARALVHDPTMLLMDEPAAGLDPRARIELRELLKALISQKKAILISSHILTELAEICTGAVIIERGKLLHAGTLDQIVKHANTTHKSMAVRTPDDLHALCKFLLERPGVESARVVGEEVEVDIEGGDEAAAELLLSIIKHGVRVSEFRQRKSNLEQVFMNVTRGEVQ